MPHFTSEKMVILSIFCVYFLEILICKPDLCFYSLRGLFLTQCHLLRRSSVWHGNMRQRLLADAQSVFSFFEGNALCRHARFSDESSLFRCAVLKLFFICNNIK